jgi:pentatricopeptide repeat protein
MCLHSQPNATHFTMMVDAYGREARRTRIKDLYQRWLSDKDHHLQSQRKSHPQSIDDDIPVIEGVDPAEVARIKAKEARATRARVLREKSAGFPIHRPLYPAVRLDTVAYNAMISSYTTSLAVESLTSSSPALSFPFSLLSSFRADAKTFSILMALHCRMRDTGRVLQLFEDFKRMRHEENLQLHGQRPLQHIRLQRKEESQYLQSILLRSLGQAGEVEAAERVWAGLKVKEEANQITLTRPLYHSMLEMYARMNEHEKMRALTVEMRRKGMDLDADGVCTVIHALCKAGHIDDACMIHRRLQHGSLGLASPHRKSYLALLSHLCALPSVPFFSVLSVFDEGMKGGWLRSPTAHRQKWMIDLRGLPLWLIPVSLHWHLHDGLNAFMERWRREGRQKAIGSIPHRGLLILLGKNRKERDQDITDAFRSSLSSHDEGYHPHALSISALDPDAEEEEEEKGGSVAKAGDRVLVDPFATEEERTLLSRLDEWQVKGSYVQRYVQSLMKQQWPAMSAHLKEESQHPSDPTHPSPPVDASSPVLVTRSSLPSSTSALLIVRRNDVMFWLCARAHIRGEQEGEGRLFTAPRLHGAKGEWMATIKRNVGEEEKREREGGMSLTQRLQEWKKNEREALQSKARVFHTKRPLPTHPLHQRTPHMQHPRMRAVAVAADAAAPHVPTVVGGDAERRGRVKGVGEGEGVRGTSSPKSVGVRRVSRVARSLLSSSTLSALLRSQSPLTPRTRAVVQEMAKEEAKH